MIDRPCCVTCSPAVAALSAAVYAGALRLRLPDGDVQVADSRFVDDCERVDANAAWDVATAVRAIADLDKAAAGLDTSEQPCVSIEEAGRRTPVAAEPHHVHRQRISQAAQYSGLGADTHFVLVVLTVCGGCGQAGTDLAAGFPRLRVETPGLASGLSRMWRRSVPGQH